jgi:hypothetical protein
MQVASAGPRSSTVGQAMRTLVCIVILDVETMVVSAIIRGQSMDGAVDSSS